jgi:hypothetical protein
MGDRRSPAVHGQRVYPDGGRYDVGAVRWAGLRDGRPPRGAVPGGRRRTSACESRSRTTGMSRARGSVVSDRTPATTAAKRWRSRGKNCRSRVWRLGRISLRPWVGLDRCPTRRTSSGTASRVSDRRRQYPCPVGVLVPFRLRRVSRAIRARREGVASRGVLRNLGRWCGRRQLVLRRRKQIWLLTPFLSCATLRTARIIGDAGLRRSRSRQAIP